MSTVRPEWPDLSARITNSRHTEESREIEETIHLVDTIRIETLLLGAGLQWIEQACTTYCSSPVVATSFVDVAQADI
jgi:hypothetical protein